jgi:hypothetical protein
MRFEEIVESRQSCPECGGPMFSEMVMNEKKDACYYKVKASAKVWPSAYASGRLVQCRKKGAANYGNKNESLREFAPAGGGGSGDYFQALASAWYNGVFDTGSLPKGIKTQEDVERLLNRGIVCPDGKTRKLHIDYNSDFDGVEIYSDDYYEHGDHDATIDSRTGQKWGPYDFMAFSDEDLSEGLNEFAADDGDSGEDDVLRKYARMWWAGDDATQQKIEAALARMGWEIGEDEGGYDNGGVFVVRAGDENGKSYMSWSAEDLTENVYTVDHNNPFGPQGRFVGDTGPARISTTVPRHEFRAGDRVMYKPTGARATIENLYKNGTVARIHVASGMGGQYFDAKVADLRPIGLGLAEEIDQEIVEMYEAMDQLALEMAEKNGVSVDLVWETFESLDDHILYETAAWRRKEGKSKKGGLNRKGVASYRREHPGSKLQMAVTTKPSKLKKGSKAAKRRKSFCARMSGVKGPMKKPNGKPTRKALALRKWNC